MTQFGKNGERKKDAYKAFFGNPDWVDPEPLGFFTDEARTLDRFMIRKMIDRVRAHGAQPVFLYFPSILVPVSADLSRTFQEDFGAPLIVPEPALRRQLEDGLYFDNSHLNTQGRLVFSDWFGRELMPILQGRAE